MKIAELCERVWDGRAQLVATGMTDLGPVVVVISDDDFRAIDDEFMRSMDPWQSRPRDLGRRFVVSPAYPGEAPRVLGLPVHADSRLQPGEVRLRTEVSV